jgi:hypothetical protein
MGDTQKLPVMTQE